MTLVFVSVGVAMVATLGTLVLALTGTSPIPLPGFPDATRNADRNPEVTPAPAPTAPTGLDGTDATTGAAGPSATPTTTKKGNVPSHTPTHPRPTKTR